MLLEYLRLQGFRRFEQPTKLQLTGKLVAIVGPNEAGKTSLLKAIECVSDNRAVADSDHTYLSDVALDLRLGFFLEEADLKAAKLEHPSWLEVQKEADGRRYYKLSPMPERDFSARRACANDLKRLLGSARAQRILVSHGDPLDAKSLSEGLDLLLQTKRAYKENELTSLEGISSSLSDISRLPLPAYATSLGPSLSRLIQFEKTHDPLQYALNQLAARVPDVLFFSDEDRDLGLPYNIALFDHGDPNSRRLPSKPLAELIRKSGLDLPALIAANKSKNQAIKAGLLADANERLREMSNGLWTQSDASLFFTLESNQLDVLVEHLAGFSAKDRYNNFRDRSDGYRQFIALQIFCLLRESIGSVLLIDEIERHLHYDGQADLIQLLQREPSVQKVIYTTHSAGALPEDLGAGVRLVEWNADNPKTSRVVNKFWQDSETDGFRPLLFGMGAATFAFFPTRRALIGEGATELLLLPRLFREALEVDSLDFQVLHGLANINPKGLPMLDSLSAGVAYIVDGDRDGNRLKSALLRVGVPEQNVFSVGQVGSAITIEDLVDDEAWREAVNLEIRKLQSAGQGVREIVDVPVKGRIGALPRVAAARKVAVAYNLLDIVSNDPSRRLLRPPCGRGLRQVAISVREALRLEPLPQKAATASGPRAESA